MDFSTFVECLEENEFCEAEKIALSGSFDVNQSLNLFNRNCAIINSQLVVSLRKEADKRRDYSHFASYLVTPLLMVLVNLDKDCKYQNIAKILINREDCDVNIGCGIFEKTAEKAQRTILHFLCIIPQKSTRALELILNDERCDVNAGLKNPLAEAIKNTESYNDYFYKATRLLLQHKNVNVNAEMAYKKESILQELCFRTLKSCVGVELLLAHGDIHLYKGSPAYWAAHMNKMSLLSLFLKHPKFDVNKICSCCDNSLAIEGVDFQNLWSMDSKKGQLLRYLLKNGASLNLPGKQNNFLSQLISARFSSSKHFKTNPDFLKILEFMLENGADPNVPASLFAQVATYCPFDVFELFLKHNAKPDSAFEKLTEFPNFQQLREFKQLYDDGRETAVHNAFRSGSQKKIELIMTFASNKELKWIGETPTEIKKKYSAVNPDNSLKMYVDQERSQISLDKIRKCRDFMKSDETKLVYDLMRALLTKIHKNMLKLFDITGTLHLSGSFMEQTKCFAPNEFDFLCMTSVEEKELVKFSQKFYLCLDALIRLKDSSTISEDNRLQTRALLHENKIAKLHFLWRGAEFIEMDIFVDVVVCNARYLAKFDRHFGSSGENLKFNDYFSSFHEMKSLSKLVRRGYILSKAVRLAAIAQPDNLANFDLIENANVDDFVTSYVLKRHLFGHTIDQYTSNIDGSNPPEIAIKLYERLRGSFSRTSLYDRVQRDEIIQCQFCVADKGCCKRRKFVLVLVDRILQWLKENQDQLQDIDYVDDDETLKLFQFDL